MLVGQASIPVPMDLLAELCAAATPDELQEEGAGAVGALLSASVVGRDSEHGAAEARARLARWLPDSALASLLAPPLNARAAALALLLC